MANKKGNTAGSRAKAPSGGSAAKRGTQKGRPRANPAPQRRRAEHPDEIAGVVLIALGIVLGILTYSSTGAVMHAAVKWLFGLTGVVAYALPVLLAVLGIALIAIPNKQTGTGAAALAAGAVFCVDCIIHLAASPVAGSKFAPYVRGAWTLGAELHGGGGALASVPVFALANLFSKSGAIVIFVAAAIVCLLLLTRVSIRSAGQKVIAKVDAMEDRRKARIYSARQEEEEYESSRHVPADIELDPEPAARTKRGRKSKPAPSFMDDPADIAAEPVYTPTDLGGAQDTLDFLPLSGALPRQQAQARGELNAFDIGDDPVTGGADADPFGTIEITPQDNITGETADIAPEPEKHKRPAKKAEQTGEPGEAGDEDLSAMETPHEVKQYQRPPISLLQKPDHSEQIAGESPEEKGRLLMDTLAGFGIQARLINITVGPVITRFELQPAQGIRVNKITTLSNDIALALAAPRVRIEAPIPGKAAIGIEIPNKETAMVRLREVVDSKEFTTAKSPLTMALGKDIAGKPVVADLERMPHMLIAGATGSGKSVCINGIILSFIYKASPDELRMILIDPKVVELSEFASLPHLYCPVVTDAKKAAGVLKWAVLEMETRYKKMGKLAAKDLARYNALQEDPAEVMPRLVIIIDELADLMMVSSKDVEESICRIAQLGRACGIHLIVATQRPSVDVITGLIKTNIPSRIAFAVSSATDSRVILDGGGAEKLLGRGDMLFHANGAAKPIRAQGAYVGDSEVEGVMRFFIDSGLAPKDAEQELPVIPDLAGGGGQGNGKQEDELLPDAVRVVMDSGSASISMIQRRLRVGYARAARLVDIMEQKKIVSGFDGSKPRKVLIDEAGYASMFGGAADYDGDGEEDDLPFEE